MSDSAMTGGDPETVDVTSHQSVTNDAVAGEPVQNPGGGSIFDALDAEAAEERHLDERHATGEHATDADIDPLETDVLPDQD
ncbi:hypothetical protein IWX78_000680 [Mycetocola sp. CAN_C7]|uniref:hypothetical protein n=1 Tax=Mycetocola sp. CAN_C7 TaxID=2787724 RepID=UPI0018CAF677